MGGNPPKPGSITSSRHHIILRRIRGPADRDVLMLTGFDQLNSSMILDTMEDGP
jgi:hypothetical protein